MWFSGCFKTVKRDIDAIFANDPAATNLFEVLLCYPGLHAIWIHRLSHRFYKWRRVTLARIISHIGRFLTGIEIHPGASLACGVVIDHGMGIVIGETAEVGEGCLLYQGVTLGGTTLSKGKRHPTLGRNVVVGTGAAILGAVRIGDGSRIGAGSVVFHDVPPGAIVVGVPGRVKEEAGRKIGPLEHADLPDPQAELIRDLAVKQRDLEDRLRALENKVRPSGHAP
ncbi:MAG: serine O-acetyltransferase [Elusimicrobia bacterium]|nr:serine O-acetyltransferase [Elusimicrobiota bacterium]